MTESYRMYILVKDTVPDNYVPLMVGHAVIKLMWEFEFNGYNRSDWVYTWIEEHNMKKIICRVSEQEFQQAISEVNGYIIQSETSGLDPEHLTDCIAAFVPRLEYPKSFKYFKLWTVKDGSN